MDISNEAISQLNKSGTIEQLGQSGIVPDISLQQVTKGLAGLAPGDRFDALVMDIKPGRVTLRLSDGNELTARSLVLPEAHIGDNATFQVKENVNGQILLEMVKPDERGAVESIIKEALSAAHMQFTEQNAEIVNMLMKANLPIDAKAIQKAAYFKYAAPELSDKEIIFFVKENFSANEKTIETYKGFIDKTIKLDKNINLLLNEMENIEGLKSRVSVLRNKLILNLKENGLKNVGEYFEEVEKTVSELKTFFAQNKITGEAVKQLDYVQDNLKLMDNVSRYKQFLQIPFIMDGRVNQAELHVFNRKKGKKGANDNNGNATAVLLLDYGNLGHVEVVVNKIQKSVTLQFKSDNADSMDLLKANLPKLIGALKEKGYETAQISFKRTEEKFDITDGIELDRQAGNAEIKRYSFDMRV